MVDLAALLAGIAPFWLWFALGGALLAVEVLIAPIGFFLCIGTAACIVGLLSFLVPGIPVLWELSVFALLCVAVCYAWWTFLRKRRGGIDEKDEKGEKTAASLLNARTRQLVGYQALLEEPLRAGKGRLRVNDSFWPAQADADYPAGTLVEVLAVDGITLKIRETAAQ